MARRSEPNARQDADQAALQARPRCSRLPRREKLCLAILRLGAEVGVTNSTAEGIYRHLLNAIELRKNEKLCNWLYEKDVKLHLEKPAKPPRDFAVNIVRLKHTEKKPLKSQASPVDAAPITYEELNPVERRAVDLLCGGKSKLKKNPIELQAAALAKAVRFEWLRSSSRKSGRPNGAPAHSGIKIVNQEYRVPLSIREVVDVALPIIETFAGKKLVVNLSPDVAGETKSLTFAVLIAAVEPFTPVFRQKRFIEM